MKTCILFDRGIAEKTGFLQTELSISEEFFVESYQVNADTIEFHLEVKSKQTIWEIVVQCLELNLPHGFAFHDNRTKRLEEAKRKLSMYHV